MPGGDGTGPLGRGPLTGRGMGYCVVKVPDEGQGAEGFAGAAGWPVEVDPSGAQKLAYLKGRIEYLTAGLEDIRARIREMEKRKS